MIRGAIVMILGGMLLIGCTASSKKMNDIRLGMTKTELIESIGEPDNTSANQEVEYLRYRLRSDGWFTDEYFVRLQEGKVNAYGRTGDFGLGY